MAEAAYIFDAIRTLRSKGKADGSLNEVKPIDLVTGLNSPNHGEAVRAGVAREKPVFGRAQDCTTNSGELPHGL